MWDRMFHSFVSSPTSNERVLALIIFLTVLISSYIVFSILAYFEKNNTNEWKVPLIAFFIPIAYFYLGPMLEYILYVFTKVDINFFSDVVWALLFFVAAILLFKYSLKQLIDFFKNKTKYSKLKVGLFFMLLILSMIIIYILIWVIIYFE